MTLEVTPGDDKEGDWLKSVLLIGEDDVGSIVGVGRIEVVSIKIADDSKTAGVLVITNLLVIVSNTILDSTGVLLSTSEDSNDVATIVDSVSCRGVDVVNITAVVVSRANVEDGSTSGVNLADDCKMVEDMSVGDG